MSCLEHGKHWVRAALYNLKERLSIEFDMWGRVYIAKRNSELLNKQVNSDMKNKIKLGVVAFTLIPIIKRLRQED